MLIGVEDLKTPAWAEAIETVGGSSAGRMLRSAPIALGVLVRMAWRASPRLTLLAAVVELASGCATAFGLLATANVLTQLLQQGPTPQRVVAALPALLLVMASYAARGMLEAAVGAVHAVLAPRVELHAQDELHAAVIGVELVAFDDADFVELVRRAAGQGIASVGQGVTDAGNLLSSAISLAAAIVTAGLLNPVLAPVVLLASADRGATGRGVGQGRAPQDRDPAAGAGSCRHRYGAGLRRARGAALSRSDAAGSGRRGGGRDADCEFGGVHHGLHRQPAVRAELLSRHAG
jgi:ATP-binding cassette subfamily B protein